MIHQIINNTIPDDISVGYLGGDDDETIMKPPNCLTTSVMYFSSGSVPQYGIQITFQ